MPKNTKAALSVVISAFNEEKMIASCIRSVSWADEIIVVDNSSTDQTASIAKKHGAMVYTRENNPMLNVSKNYGFSKATHDLILNLDADETIGEELKKEIQAVLSGTILADGYEIPRKNMIFGKWIRHAGWYPDYQIRLFKKAKGRFEQKHVHEKIAVSGSVKRLSGHIIHQNYRSVSHFLSKLDLYTSNEAENKMTEGYVFNKMDAVLFPKDEFFSRYFAREGYKDGLHGLCLSLLMAFYHFVVFLKLWEKKKFVGQDMSIEAVYIQTRQIQRESAHWFSKARGFSHRVINKFIHFFT